MILLYWDIGRQIQERQDKEGWGAKIIKRLSEDLKHEFSDMKGGPPRNLKYMRIFAKNYPEIEFVQEALAQIPWYHNIAIFEKIKEPIECEWYICKTVAHGWCQNLLVRQTPTEKLPKNIEALSWVHGISREAMRRAVGGRGMYLF